MWYALQIGIIISVAYFWCTLQGNSPNDFGHGCFLGIILAWLITVLVTPLLPNKLKRSTRVITGAGRSIGQPRGETLANAKVWQGRRK